MRYHYLTLLWILIIVIWPVCGFSQVQIQHTAPTVIESSAETELQFNVPGLSSSEVQEAYLFYRPSGEVSYKQTAAAFQQGSFRVSLGLPDEDISSVEYYFMIQTNEGERITYPGQSPSQDPIQVEIVDQPVRKKQTAEKQGPVANISYNILSPDPGSSTSNRDVVVAITFFYEDTTLQEGQFQLIVDGENVTEQAEAQSYFLSYVPELIGAGQHHVEVRYELDGRQYKITDWQFTVDASAAAEDADVATGRQQPTRYATGTVEFSARNQQIGQSRDDILRGLLQIRGRRGDVRYSARGNLTTQESWRLQPQNRFGAELLFGDWGELRAGDFYEQMSRLTLGGQRVRGVNAEIHLNNDHINGMFLYGRMRRGITNLYEPIQSSFETIDIGNQQIVDSTFTLGFNDRGRGAYQRDIIGGRLSFGDQTPIRWGINALKVEDDTTSIDPVEDFFDAQSRSEELVNTLNQDELQYLQQNPEKLSVASSVRPKGNFVASTDLSLNLDRNRIRFDAEVGASLLNENIDGGYLTRERADDLGLELNQGMEDLLSRLSWLIIINENMSTLPLRFEETDSGDRELEPFVPMGIFGGRSRASFNYFDHRLQIQYRWMGPSYRSLANSTIRRDLSGFNVSDRFSLFQDQLYITLGYERLEDNVLNTEDATTRTSTYRTNVSWYPVSRDLPRISGGVRLRDRGNGIERTNPALTGDPLLAAVRNARIAGSDTVIAPRPVQSFTTQLNGSISQQFEIGEVVNDATLNVSYLHTDDRVFRYGGLESMSYSFQLQNRYTNLPLNTNIGFHLNRSDSRGGLSSFDIYGFSLGGTAFLMDDQLRLSSRFAFTHNAQTSTPLDIETNDENNVFDNYYYPDTDQQTRRESNTYVMSLNARYQLAARHSLLAQANFTNVVTQEDARSLPNDQILEIRYIFEF